MRWLLVAVFVAGCPSAFKPGPCDGSGGMSTGGSGTGSFQDSAALTGVRQSVHLESPVSGCLASSELSVTAKVYDQDNVEVPATVEHVVLESFIASADVVFTPVNPGNHHLTARFEPNLGIQQADVVVVADRRGDKGTAVQVPSGTTCDAVTLLPSTAVLCLRTSRSLLEVYRAGALVQSITGVSAYATRGDVVWTGGVTLVRWEDRGAGMLARSGAIGGASGAQLKILPGGDVLEITPGHIYRSGFDGGAVVQPFVPVAVNFSGPVALSPGGLRVLGIGARGACVASVPGQGPAESGCSEQTGSSIGADHGGVWSGNNGSGLVTYFAALDTLPLDGGQVTSSQLTLPNNWIVQSSTFAPAVETSVPGFGPAGPAGDSMAVGSGLPRASGGTLILEEFAPKAGTARGDDVQVLVTAPDGTMRVVQRGP